jgi:hypothetical protein
VINKKELLTTKLTLIVIGLAYASLHRMETANTIRVIVGVTIIIALAGIAVVVAASLLAQSVSATSDAMNAANLTRNGAIASSNNNSIVSLGNLFYSAQTVEEAVNPVNETYIVISYLDNVMLMPPNATTGVVINATERGNFTVNVLPNGLSLNQGQGLIMTQDGGQEESATATFASLGRTNPDGTGSGTGAVFFSTNSTGQLAFLNNMVGITQVEISSEGTTVKIWEWKSGILPSRNGG